MGFEYQNIRNEEKVTKLILILINIPKGCKKNTIFLRKKKNGDGF